MMGWHYFQMDNLSEAQRWLEESLKLDGNNAVARTYLELIQKERAAGPNARLLPKLHQ